jgi:hypothetical protein
LFDWRGCEKDSFRALVKAKAVSEFKKGLVSLEPRKLPPTNTKDMPRRRWICHKLPLLEHLLELRFGKGDPVADGYTSRTPIVLASQKQTEGPN